LIQGDGEVPVPLFRKVAKKERRNACEGDAMVLWYFFASLRLCVFALKILLSGFLPNSAPGHEV
jgi:hypothetical protein